MESDQAREYQRRYARAARMLKDMTLAARIVRAARTVSEETLPAGALTTPPGSPGRLRRIGALAGSFNPLTAAHVALGSAARTAGQLDAIVWVISAVTVNKEQVERASIVDRLIQMAALVRGGPDGCALINGGLYVEQARVIRELLPTVDELALIVGYDKAEQIFDPRYYDDRDAALDALFGLATLLVSPRGDGDEARLRALLRRAENRRYARYITSAATPERYRWDSSSRARALLRSGHNAGAKVRTLLAPEGLALARLAGVYEDDGVEQADDKVNDVYAARQRAIASLTGKHDAGQS